MIDMSLKEDVAEIKAEINKGKKIVEECKDKVFTAEEFKEFIRTFPNFGHPTLNVVFYPHAESVVKITKERYCLRMELDYSLHQYLIPDDGYDENTIWDSFLLTFHKMRTNAINPNVIEMIEMVDVPIADESGYIDEFNVPVPRFSMETTGVKIISVEYNEYDGDKHD